MNAPTVTHLQQAVAYALSYDPSALARIERAAVLIALGSVQAVDAWAYSVASQTGDGTAYTVRPDESDCLDRQHHPARRCEHEWSVRIQLYAEMLNRKAAEQRERAVASAERVALAYVRSIGWAASPLLTPAGRG